MAFKEITKTDAMALLNEQKATDIIQPATTSSVVLSSFPTFPMPAGVMKMPVLATLPEAKWVGQSATDAKGKKPTTTMSWETKSMTAAELAVIVPIHENILADAGYDIWGQVAPRVAEAFAIALDRAVLFGDGKPEEWKDPAIFEAAKTAKNTVAEGTGADLAEDFNQAFAKVEEDGFDVNVGFTAGAVRSRLRGMRNAIGDPIYLDNVRGDRRTSSIYGQDLFYTPTTAWDLTKALAIVGDRNAVRIGIREDMQVKFLDQATVGDVSLAEHDMVAMRFKFRVAYATAFSTAGAKTPAEVYPFAALTPKAK